MHFQLFSILDLLGDSPHEIARRAMNGSAWLGAYFRLIGRQPT